MFRSLVCYSLLFLGSPLMAKEVVVADFEGADFGDWKATGDAFGKGPEHGAINGQMAVTGFEGKGFVNGFHGGDASEGKLVSPAFKVEGKYLNFLIGGGGFAGETCMNLISGGKVVLTATGANVSPGGSEKLEWQSWDLSGLMGKTVSLEIVDKYKGPWGHLSVDQIVQSDTAKMLDVRKEFTVDKRYLIWPVTLDKSQRRRFFFTQDAGKEVWSFSDICLTDKPDFWAFTDLANFKGKKIAVNSRLPSELAAAWDQVKLSDTYPGEGQLYHEPLRPQYHFSSRRGWINDPNGLVWRDGLWHLFYQHNPYNHGWDNMHWGHATSRDLFHWEERPDALFPDAEGYMYSGSAVMVPKGKGGFPVKGENAMALIYTAEGTRNYVPGKLTTQALAVSNDGGVTFQKFAGNPILPHVVAENRDPKVFWHEPSKHWVMPLFYDGSDYGIYTSPDLVKWTKTSDYKIPGNGECPDLFELPVDGNPKDTRWVAWGATGGYVLGKFDGKEFKPETKTLRHYFGAAYAGQTYSNAPEGRRVHIGWMRDEGPVMAGMPFNLQMTLPIEFTLRHDGAGALRVWSEPAKEIEAQREIWKEWKDLNYGEGGSEDPLADFQGGSYAIDAVVDVAGSTAAEMGFQIGGEHRAVWKKADQTFSDMEGVQAPVNGKLHMQVFVDTVSMEVFVNGTYLSRYIRQKEGAQAVKIVASGGAVKFDSLKAYRVNPVWK